MDKIDKNNIMIIKSGFFQLDTGFVSTTPPESQIQKGLLRAQVDYIQPPAFS